MKCAGIAVLALWIFPFCVLAQTDVCWRESFPVIPGQWASQGYVVEAGNRFQRIESPTVELRSTTLTYEEAKARLTRGEEIDSNLVKTVMADAEGKFSLGTLLSGRYEIRASMAGREPAIAYLETDISPQWMGRGLRIALSHEMEGCSRIYAAGLDDTDCGRLNCEKLPVGNMRIVHGDGAPLDGKRLLFYRHSKTRPKSPELVLTTGVDGSVPTTSAHGCYDVLIDDAGQIHLCFQAARAREEVTVVLAPNSQ